MAVKRFQKPVVGFWHAQPDLFFKYFRKAPTESKALDGTSLVARLWSLRRMVVRPSSHAHHFPIEWAQYAPSSNPLTSKAVQLVSASGSISSFFCACFTACFSARIHSSITWTMLRETAPLCPAHTKNAPVKK